MYKMTAAHKTLPLPTYVAVRNLATGREIVVRVNDRGPFHGDRIIDLSYAAATKLGIARRGTGLVEGAGAGVRVRGATRPGLRADTIRTGQALRSGGAFQAATNAVRLRTRLAAVSKLPVRVRRAISETVGSCIVCGLDPCPASRRRIESPIVLGCSYRRSAHRCRVVVPPRVRRIRRWRRRYNRDADECAPHLNPLRLVSSHVPSILRDSRSGSRLRRRAGSWRPPAPRGRREGSSPYRHAAPARVLSAGGADEPLEPASLTKMLTSYVVFAEMAQGKFALSDEVPGEREGLADEGLEDVHRSRNAGSG